MAAGEQHLCIPLLDTARDWTYDLHSADGRVWLTALAEQVPVDLRFAFGASAPEIVRTLSVCRTEAEMAIAARCVLPRLIVVKSNAGVTALAA